MTKFAEFFLSIVYLYLEAHKRVSFLSLPDGNYLWSQRQCAHMLLFSAHQNDLFECKAVAAATATVIDDIWFKYMSIGGRREVETHHSLL